MSSESTRLTSEAMTLSAAAVLNSLISVLGNKGLLSPKKSGKSIAPPPR